jgi:hypothetical protein
VQRNFNIDVSPRAAMSVLDVKQQLKSSELTNNYAKMSRPRGSGTIRPSDFAVSIHS